MNKLSYYLKSIAAKENLGLLFICILFYFISKGNYLLFHSLVEIITIIISFSIMLIAIGTIKICDNNYFTYLGIVYGFVGIINIFHIFTYKGIVILTTNSNIATQLWIANRYYESILLLVSFHFLKNKPNLKKLLALNSIIVFLILLAILLVKIFPVCYIDGQGLTKFKIYSEFIISVIFLLSIFLLNSRKEFKNYKESRKVIVAIFFKIFAELCFVLYLGVYDFTNFMGHILSFISFYFLFIALFRSVIINPYSSLFGKLNLKAAELEKKNEELIMVKDKVEKEYLKYQNLVEFLPDGLLAIEDEKITYVNNRLCSMFGIDNKNKLLGNSFYEMFNCSYRALMREKLSLQNRLNLINPIEHRLCFNGNTLDVEISKLSMKNEEDKEYSILIIRDIGDRKKVDEMEFILRQKEKEEAFKNQFFANISHELRTPINVIYSALQLEGLYLDKRDLNSIIKYNSTIKQNCLRLIRITNNIIDTTKIQNGFFKPKLKNQNIVNLIEKVTLSITTFSDYKNINVVFDTDEEEIYVYCDENLIERIMLNLLSNSIKYGKEGGNIEVNVYRLDNYLVQVSVKDDGIGIPESLHDNVFDRFAKGDKSISRNTEGSGIGLYLVKAFVKLQNGSVSLKSEIDKGTEIMITFPISEAAEEICADTLESDKIPECNMIEKIEIEFSDIYK